MQKPGLRSRPQYYLDWLFKDLHGRKGSYVIVEVPNAPLLIFMITIVLGVVLYPGLFQKLCLLTAFLSLSYWSYLEATAGRSRFRKLLGILGFVAIAVSVVLIST